METIYKSDGVYLNPIVSGMIQFQDVQLLGGMTYNEKGKDWGNLVMGDRIEEYYNYHGCYGMDTHPSGVGIDQGVTYTGTATTDSNCVYVNT